MRMAVIRIVSEIRRKFSIGILVMPRCAVNVCQITSGEAKKSENLISFHSFPKEPTKRAKWLKFCGIMKDPGTVLYVCSQHFNPDAFATNATIKRDLISCGRNILVKDAIPSIRTVEVGSSTDRCKRYRRKEQKALVAQLLQEYDESTVGRDDNIAGAENASVDCAIEDPSDTVRGYSNMDVLLEAIELAVPIPLDRISTNQLACSEFEDIRIGDTLEDSGCQDVLNSTLLEDVETVPSNKSEKITTKRSKKLDYLEGLARRRKAKIKLLQNQVPQQTCL
ncbi:uncharacterized protein LOC134221318 [Armigeres subalbatus]|uniref:uncharacterized protein LOC134221318 n=1 Tax=Armigeres subalbatus TaxID=124917 RepID=UPI002ED34067